MGAFGAYDWIIALGFIGAALDAYGIGANDVANSFATSVSSRSLTLFQATIAAAICEFLGAVLAGSRVTDTIRSKIIQTSTFNEDPAVLMLAMLVALSVSATWLLVATKIGFTVSTTHSITFAVVGVGVAATGTMESVSWGWKGVGGIIAGWAIAPGIAGILSAIIYTICRLCILERKDSAKKAIMFGPLFFFAATAILVMNVVWKGSPGLKLNNLATATTVAAIFGTASVVALLAFLFWVPFVYARVIRGDYTVRWWDFFRGPLLWRRVPPADAGAFTAPAAVPDYYKGHGDTPAPEIAALSAFQAGTHAVDEKNVRQEALGGTESPSTEDKVDLKSSTALTHDKVQFNAEGDLVRPHLDGDWYLPSNLVILAKHYTIRKPWHNMTRDVVAMQAGGSDRVASRIAAVHAQAKQHPNSTEHAFSFLQVMTACVMSFSHGANDVSNAIGPFSTIYLIWRTGATAGSRSPVPVWILVYGATFIVIGLATYGYKMMSRIGNRITLHSPSRGFAMEAGAATTVVIATQLALPVSTTQTIVGSTVAVGLCGGSWRAVNWRQVLWIIFGWILTVPLTSLASGLVFAILLNSPRFGYASTVASQYE
ncbi:uncharacterized protein L969DRAFT_47320 [Mixia osmundae IAM 14324]|uniref:Phosphate transporter n=1 Tax=Mixia osmundae (strain CBS 9802 / IAM 14324 / JCM 22182 / KY 12970) TaxID=764103 RepID=G7DWB7_MIXOS|nr:uncharacterized protein L969DRAFT_47320 [Mixia osmundae IAM 14324]KEI40366.1 hypothetical protein L969DRAFT_47320 [Mixia osmundae IAM 14324]GAA94877.1 hypothetical protein E5Q_01532 [Mixia osmundae IAM 14324]